MQGMRAAILCGLRDAAVERRLEAACAHFGGARIVTAHDTASLLRGLGHPELAVVVADLKFGETDIFEILRLVRARPDGGAIGVLLALPAMETDPAATPTGSRRGRLGGIGSGQSIDYVAMARTQGVAGIIPPSLDTDDLLALIAPYIRERYRQVR
ncbi:hypothetical protein KAJ83_14280 [Marivibrio halodurans]|uniref:Uncharacterized protein n=1 Tax=Marivibrio halodurans TaxID=2039722 RepID=A0A8J7V4X9_9PROT|nr:hypothetical protein [Marivibrio halodurans]MBP5858184.1 hypothetical protein [Marivibrio halodurans]